MTPEERITDLETAFVTITRLAQDFNDRLLTHDNWINMLGESKSDSDAKIAALTDGHIRLEEVQVRMEEAQVRLEEAQANSEAKIAALADGQIRQEEAQKNLEEAHKRTEAALERLAEAQAYADARMAALADAVIKREEAQAKSDAKIAELIDIVRREHDDKH